MQVRFLSTHRERPKGEKASFDDASDETFTLDALGISLPSFKRLPGSLIMHFEIEYRGKDSPLSLLRQNSETLRAVRNDMTKMSIGELIETVAVSNLRERSRESAHETRQQA